MDFTKEKIDGINIITVNLERASFMEATDFNNILNSEIEQGRRNLLVDLSKCCYIDPVFLGSVILAMRKLVILEGEIKLIVSGQIQKMNELMTPLRVFNIFSAKADAIESYQKPNIKHADKIGSFGRTASVNTFLSN